MTKPKTIYLKDYKKPTHEIEKTNLTFHLHEEYAEVHAKLQIRQVGESDTLELHGENLELLHVSHANHDEKEGKLILRKCPKEFELETRVKIYPNENKTLEGLYRSGDVFCTQCESEGFRHITYFLDRPDCLSKFRVKVHADPEKFPILLSNGNLVEKGAGFALWDDPWPKPSYLFALVAGDLGSINDSFTTKSGRHVELNVYCDKGNEGRCEHAMGSLKKSMTWDEEVYGREYDLDIFNIVVVDAFNFGAMENKGLNIFNSNAALADPKTATDFDFYRVEGVVAHEYFHNWTGNRVTCRDWFQLTLKEGLTVFRDEEFSSDMNSRTEKRIEVVSNLRSSQFPEDAGPTAHPIQPKSYIEVNNFYTMTVYRKGSEVIRMLHTLLGEKDYRKGTDKYFELYDGQAVTTEDFIHAFEVATCRDLTQFRRWYHQVGTPRLEVKFLDQEVEVTQENVQELLHFPLKIDGVVHEMTKKTERFPAGKIPSINQGFSAPVIVEAPYKKEDLIHLMLHDSDLFNRWDAAQELASRLMLKHTVDEDYIEAFGKLMEKTEIASILTLPSETMLFERQDPIEIEQNFRIREMYLDTLATRHEAKWMEMYKAHDGNISYHFDPESVKRRKMKNTALSYLARAGHTNLAYQQYIGANNMTDCFSALAILANFDCAERKRALEHFADQWKDDPLVMTKWFAIQAGSKLPNRLAEVKGLMDHPSYDSDIPNLVRALIGSFAGNHIQFHTKEGYEFFTDQIEFLDRKNPHVAGRLALAYRKFGKLDPKRKSLMQKGLEHLVSLKGISGGTYEIVSKCLSPQASLESA